MSLYGTRVCNLRVDHSSTKFMQRIKYASMQSMTHESLYNSPACNNIQFASLALTSVKLHLSGTYHMLSHIYLKLGIF